MTKIAIIDIETTGFNCKNDLILEIGIAELNLSTGEINVLYDELVKEKNLSHSHKKSWVFLNSSLNFNDIISAKPLDFETIQNIFNKYPVTAFNRKFDFSFLESRGFNLKPLPCPMLALTNVCKIPNNRGGYKWPKVQEAWDILFPNTPYIEEHRGFDDAKHEAKLVYYLHKNNIVNYSNTHNH